MEVPHCRSWQVTNPCVPGVSQVVVFGGDVRQYQVLVDQPNTKAFDVFEDVTKAAIG